MKTLRHGMMWSHLFLQNINIVTRGKIKHFYQIWERDHEVSMSAMMVRIERYNNYRYNTKGNLWNLVNNQIWDINMEETKKVISVVCWGQFALTPKSRFCISVPNFLFSDIKVILESTMVWTITFKISFFMGNLLWNMYQHATGWFLVFKTKQLLR